MMGWSTNYLCHKFNFIFKFNDETRDENMINISELTGLKKWYTRIGRTR